MRNSIQLCVCLLFLGCGAASAPPVPPGGSLLSDTELGAARSVPSTGDAMITLDGNEERRYVGSIIVEVIGGATTDVNLTFVTLARSPTESLGGQVVIPEELATTLSTTGWDFALSGPEIAPPNGISGEALFSAPLDRLEVRADPNGLFVMNMTMTDDTGRARTAVATGRLTGGCSAVDEGGSLMRVTDVTSDSRCSQILGGF